MDVRSLRGKLQPRFTVGDNDTMLLFPHNRLVLATRNRGKVAEIADLLAGQDVDISTAEDLDLPEVEETGTTFEENALLKARSACEASGYAALADDSGLSVAALGGAPGVYSADWAGEERDYGRAMERIQREVEEATGDRRAFFVSQLVLYYPGGNVISARGEVHGTLVFPPRGDAGFGYDPCFVPDGDERTFAQMTREEKSAFSHRSRALRDLMTKILP
ncbi:MAG: RdgB/HAM1 family non-canonical purine NTP pyrophosphatase [Parvularcula sp.]|jgi:XTP/dITP diphosphohydrolase|nr:RdgB/HAM1 family non-canonical purine NTP pyrophosphatase [Parvularcula sp.]